MVRGGAREVPESKRQVLGLHFSGLFLPRQSGVF